MEDKTSIIKHLCECNSDKIMDYPNVVGVGLGYKCINNMQTDTHALCVFVDKKYPLDKLCDCDVIPSCYMGVPTDVIEIGRIYSYAFTSKLRPMQFGYSVGILGVNSAGTPGCMVSDRLNPSILYMLSNNHVIANTNSAAIDSRIIQPSQIDGGTSLDVVANLSKYIPIEFDKRNRLSKNYVDCAIAKLVSNTVATSVIAGIGVPSGIGSVYLNQPVKKSGRTTSVTTGVVNYTSATVKVSYGNTRTATFYNQIITTMMSSPGDSGSLLLDNDNKALGLLFAGSSTITIYNPIVTVLNNLGINLVTTLI